MTSAETARKAQILDGKATAAAIKAELTGRVAALKAKGIIPGLGTILVGSDPGSTWYVAGKHKDCAEVGITSIRRDLPEETSQDELLTVVRELNENPECTGYIVQLPLPKHIDQDVILEAMDPEKDADGLHPMNLGNLLGGKPGAIPCTPAGCVEILDHYGIPIEGAEVVVIGRSRLVGKPLAQLLLGRHATVTMCHTRTRDLAAHCRRADILCVAAGRAGVVTGDMVREGVVVIDVGVNRLPTGKVTGDVHFDSVAPKARAITPVPGGVGPMTIAMLMRNTHRAALRQLST